VPSAFALRSLGLGLAVDARAQRHQDGHMSANNSRSDKNSASFSPKGFREAISHDYGIPGVSPKFYLPIFGTSFILWIAVVPNWYLPGGSDILLFLFFVGTMMAASAVSTFIQRHWRR
jgi:hypothetical protein